MDVEPHRPSFSNLFRMCVTLVWILVFWVLSVRLGGVPLLAKFLHPSYWWMIDLGTGILVCFLISLAYCKPDPNPRRGFRLLMHIAVMLIPVLYLPLAVESRLSPDSARSRSVHLMRLVGTPNGAAGHATPDKPIQDVESTTPPPETSSVHETVSLLDLQLAGPARSGRRVITEGAVYVDEKLPPGTFFCYRLLMWCCAADARPIGAIIRYTGATGVKSGDWVSIEGTVASGVINGHRVLQIVAENVTIGEQPKTPYLFP